MIKKITIEKHIASHKDMLLNQIMPFWEKQIDTKYGGIYTGLDRQGNIIETDKSVWFQGRATWTFATLYNTIEKRDKWLNAAKLCVNFIEQHCFDSDKKMFFRVTKEGKQLIQRERYIFSETFATIGFAAYAKASKNQDYISKSREILFRIYSYINSNKLIPKYHAKHRPMQGLGYHLIMVNTLQELRKYDHKNIQEYISLINEHIDQIKNFVKDDIQAVLEVIDDTGNFMKEHIEGRIINPGHAIEAGWFILNEGIYQNNIDIKTLALKIIGYAWKWGWDEIYGGMLYYRDALQYPISEYWHDMKFWWPHNEAVIAHLLKYYETKNINSWHNYIKVLEWANIHFIDKKYGEWFGYLHRDGTISSEIKGNMFKGPFHIPRMHLECIQILQNIHQSI